MKTSKQHFFPNFRPPVVQNHIEANDHLACDNSAAAPDKRTIKSKGYNSSQPSHSFVLEESGSFLTSQYMNMANNNKSFVFLVQDPAGYQGIRDITYSADVGQEKRTRYKDDARGLDKLFNYLNTRRNTRNYKPNGY